MSTEGDALGLAIGAAVKESALANPGGLDHDALYKALGNALLDHFAPNKLESSDRLVLPIGLIPDGTFLGRVGASLVGEPFPWTLPPSGAAGGDLSGTYPNPSVVHGHADTADLATIATAATFATTAGGAPPTGSASGDLSGTYPSPTVALLAITDAKVATANKDGAAGTASMRTLGTAAQQACAGNDSRLSDSRAPSGSAGGDLTGTYPNPTVAALAITDAKVAAANKDGAAGTASMRTLGTAAAQACAGNDSRLSDSRAPTGSAGGDLTGTYPNPTLAAAGAGAATYGGGAVFVNSITLDAKGRPTAIATGTPSGGGGSGVGWADNEASALATLAGLSSSACSKFARELSSLADWTVNAGTWSVPSTAVRGGAVQNNVASTPASLFWGNTQHPTKLGGAGYGWGVSMGFALQHAAAAGAFWLMSVSTNSSASNPQGIQFGYHQGLDATHYIAYSNDGTTTHQYSSTISLDTAFHVFRCWYDVVANKYYFSVDGETKIEIASIGTLSQGSTCAIMLTCSPGTMVPMILNRFVLVTGSEN